MRECLKTDEKQNPADHLVNWQKCVKVLLLTTAANEEMSVNITQKLCIFKRKQLPIPAYHSKKTKIKKLKKFANVCKKVQEWI